MCGGVRRGVAVVDCSGGMRPGAAAGCGGGVRRRVAAYCGEHRLWQRQTATAACDGMGRQWMAMAAGEEAGRRRNKAYFFLEHSILEVAGMTAAVVGGSGGQRWQAADGGGRDGDRRRGK